MGSQEYKYSVATARKDYQNWCIEEKKSYNKNEFNRNIEKYDPKPRKFEDDSGTHSAMCMIGIRKRVEVVEESTTQSGIV